MVSSRLTGDAFARAVLARRKARIGRAPRRKIIPKQLQPNAIRFAYSLALNPLLNEMRRLVDAQIVPLLPEFVAVAGQVHDAIGKSNYASELSKKIRAVSRELFGQFTNEKLRGVAKQFGARTADHNKRQLAAQFVATLGFDPLQSEPWLGPILNEFAHRNALLIKSVPARFFSEIESTTLDALRTGKRADEIAKGYQDRFGVSQSRARLIARDQIGKLNGQLNITRQRRAGIKQWVWRTSEDERVRPEHEELDGKTFGIDAPPSEGYPGEPINCRCTSEPDVQSEIEALGAEPVVESIEREELEAPRAPTPTVAPKQREELDPNQDPAPAATPPTTTTAAPSKTFPAYSSISGKSASYAVANQRLHAASEVQWRNVLKQADRQQMVDYTANSARLNAYVSGSYDPARDPNGDQSVALAARAQRTRQGDKEEPPPGGCDHLPCNGRQVAWSR